MVAALPPNPDLYVSAYMHVYGFFHAYHICRHVFFIVAGFRVETEQTFSETPRVSRTEGAWSVERVALKQWQL